MEHGTPWWIISTGYSIIPNNRSHFYSSFNLKCKQLYEEPLVVVKWFAMFSINIPRVIRGATCCVLLQWSSIPAPPPPSQWTSTGAPSRPPPPCQWTPPEPPPPSHSCFPHPLPPDKEFISLIQRWCLGPVLFKEEEGAMVRKVHLMRKRSPCNEEKIHLMRKSPFNEKKSISLEKMHLMRKSPFYKKRSI